MKQGLKFRHANRSALGQIVASGHLSYHKGMEGWRTFGHYAVAYVISGEGIYEDDLGKKEEIVPGSAILVFPTLRHYYRPNPGTTWSEYYLAFDGPVFELWEAKGILDKSTPVIQAKPVDQWLRAFESILGADGEMAFLPPLLSVCRLQDVLAKLLWQGGASVSSSADNEWAAQACALLEFEREREGDVDKVAAKMGISPASFRKKFLRLVGQVPRRYVAARIIDRACELMQTTSLSDKEIAVKLGFCDEFYFSRRFKQITGKAPKVFRQETAFGRDG
ncbi:MAG: AraC family transcriptional regulator [Puniceicoccales bacterium]|jgi:AraC-like DNA-binding protein|nr:AraC family transcriptional regulator [Puniceicoccales bacterium]